jgi:hypothetical protein
LTIALMLAVCVAAAVAIALHVVQHEQDLFEKAQYCRSASDTGCKLEIAATIERKGDSGGKSPTYYLDLAGSQPADGRFNLPEESSLWESAATGDTVTAIVWNGAVVGSQFESITVSLLCGAGLTSVAAIYVLVNWLRTR